MVLVASIQLKLMNAWLAAAREVKEEADITRPPSSARSKCGNGKMPSIVPQNIGGGMKAACHSSNLSMQVVCVCELSLAVAQRVSLSSLATALPKDQR